MGRLRLINDRDKTNVTGEKVVKSNIFVVFCMKFVKKDSLDANCYKLILYITTA
jgi:hypothetical protein